MKCEIFDQSIENNIYYTDMSTNNPIPDINEIYKRMVTGYLCLDKIKETTGMIVPKPIIQIIINGMFREEIANYKKFKELLYPVYQENKISKVAEYNDVHNFRWKCVVCFEIFDSYIFKHDIYPDKYLKVDCFCCNTSNFKPYCGNMFLHVCENPICHKTFNQLKKNAKCHFCGFQLCTFCYLDPECNKTGISIVDEIGICELCKNRRSRICDRCGNRFLDKTPIQTGFNSTFDAVSCPDCLPSTKQPVYFVTKNKKKKKNKK